MTDADRANATVKKEAKNRQMQTKTRFLKRKSEKPCTLAINKSPSASLGKLYNLTAGEYDGTG